MVRGEVEKGRVKYVAITEDHLTGNGSGFIRLGQTYINLGKHEIVRSSIIKLVHIYRTIVNG